MRVATGILLLIGGGVAVAAPSNDTYPNRTVIGSLPFAETVGTGTATTDGDDAELNATCGAPATDASVWHSYTSATDGAIIVDVSESSYTAGALVATGGPGGWTIEACGPDAVILPTTAGGAPGDHASPLAMACGAPVRVTPRRSSCLGGGSGRAQGCRRAQRSSAARRAPSRRSIVASSSSPTRSPIQPR